MVTYGNKTREPEKQVTVGHRLAHLFGTYYGRPVAFTLYGEPYGGFQCMKCKQVDNAHKSPFL